MLETVLLKGDEFSLMLGQFQVNLIFEPHRDKTNEMACAPIEDSDQHGYPTSLI